MPGRGPRTLLALFVSLLFSCQPASVESEQDPLNADKIPEILLSQIAEIGGSDTRLDYVLNEIGSATFLSDGSVAVASRMDERISLFSQDGQFLRHIGGEGGGPGEFRSLREIVSLPDGRLLAWDIQLIRATFFWPSGEVERTVRFNLDGLEQLRPIFVGATPNGQLIFEDLPFTMARREDPERIRRDTVRFILFSEDGGSWSTITSVPTPEFLFYNEGGSWGDEDLLFGRELVAAVVDGDLLIADTDSLALRFFSQAGTLESQISISRPPRPVNEEAVVAERARRIQEAEKRWEDRARNVVIRGGTDVVKLARERLSRVRVHSTLPAFADLVIAGKSGFLIREAPYPEEPVQRWFLFDKAMNPQGWFDLPVGQKVLAANDRRVLVLSKDELDRESVLIQQLERVANARGMRGGEGSRR